MRRNLILLGCLALCACSSSPNGGSSSGGSSNDRAASSFAPSAGEATGSIFLVIALDLRASNGDTTATVSASVNVTDTSGHPLSGATVTVAPLGGESLPFTESQPGLYESTATIPWPQGFTASVTQSEGSRNNIMLVAPEQVSFTFSSTPAANTATTMTWTADDDVVLGSVIAQSLSTADPMWSMTFNADPGTMPIPATVFQSGSQGLISLGREVEIKTDPSGLQGGVTSYVSQAVTIP